MNRSLATDITDNKKEVGKRKEAKRKEKKRKKEKKERCCTRVPYLAWRLISRPAVDADSYGTAQATCTQDWLENQVHVTAGREQ